MIDPTETDPLTEGEKEELDTLVEALLLPGFTLRERQIASASAKLAFQRARASDAAAHASINGDCHICHHDAIAQQICSQCRDCQQCKIAKLTTERDSLKAEHAALIAKWLDRVRQIRMDCDWCNLHDGPVWTAIHDERAKLLNECILELQAAALSSSQAPQEP